MLSGHKRPSRDLPLSAVNSPKLTCKQTKLHPNPHPLATLAGASFSFILPSFSGLQVQFPGSLSQSVSPAVYGWGGGGGGGGGSGGYKNCPFKDLMMVLNKDLSCLLCFVGDNCVQHSTTQVTLSVGNPQWCSRLLPPA